MKMKFKSRFIWLMGLILWMGLIFHFSNQKAVQSGEVSISLTYRMVENVNDIFGLSWDDMQMESYASVLEHPVRKAAHMTEYAILAWLFLGNCMQYLKLQKRSYLWAFLGAAVYAATDEFHQLFIEGRSGEFKDVCIDSMGACIGLFFAWILIRLWKNICRRTWFCKRLNNRI